MFNDKESRKEKDPVKYYISEIRTSSNNYDDMGVELYRAVCHDEKKEKKPPYTKWVATWILKCIRECFGKSVKADVLLASFALLPGYELKKSNRHARLCKYLLDSNYTQEKDGKKYPPIEQIVGEDHRTIAYEILLSFWKEDTKKDEGKNKPRKIEVEGTYVLIKDIIGQKNEEILEKIIKALKRNERNYVKKIAFHVNCEIEFNDTEKHMQELDDYGNRTVKKVTQDGKEVTCIEYEPKPEELVLTFPKESTLQTETQTDESSINDEESIPDQEKPDLAPIAIRASIEKVIEKVIEKAAEKAAEKAIDEALANDGQNAIQDATNNFQKAINKLYNLSNTLRIANKAVENSYKITLQQSKNLICFYLSFTLGLTGARTNTVLREDSLITPGFVISSEWQKDQH